MGIVIAIIIFGIIIVWHEFGHFLVAKKCDVKVNEFMIGLGPKLFGKKKGETLYSVRLLPLGGACVMEGEDGASESDRAFTSKKVWQRLLIVFAGPFFNLLMAFIIAVALIGALGVDRPEVSDVIEGYPAEAAGLAEGDTIVKLGNKNIHFYREIPVYMKLHSDETIPVVYERDGQRYETELAPKYEAESGRYLMGIYYMVDSEKVGPIKALQYGWYEMEYQIWTVVSSLKLLVQGKFSFNDLSGPVGIVKVVGDTYEESVQQGGFATALINMLNIVVLLSANLAVMNLLPIPGLDGGRLLFLLAEVITRKRIPPEKEGIIHLIGFILLFALMAVILFNDIRKLIMGGL